MTVKRLTTVQKRRTKYKFQNTRKMKNLSQLALEATNKNLATKTSKKGVNDILLEILLEKSKTKIEIISEISLMRLLEEKPNLTEVEFGTEEIQKLWNSINTTVKNGFEQSWAKGQNNASFHYNDKFKNYSLIKTGDKYSIVKI